MHRTDRYWGVISLAVFFGLLAFVFGESLLLLTAAGILAWMLALEGVFSHRIQALTADLSLTYELSHAEVRPEQSFDVKTSVTVATPLESALRIQLGYPEHAVGSPDDETVVLQPGTTETTTTCQLTIPFAGSYTVGPATATLRSAYGLFEAAITPSETASVTVEPNEPADLHVGQAGDRFAVTFGEHGSGNTGPGMVPAGMRAYTPGDPASRINWKATARLDDVYVREFEIETTRPLLVILDGRHVPVATNRDSPIEYRRHIAAALVADAAAHGDPIGLYSVTEDGVEASPRLSANPAQYLQIRDRLYTTTTPEEEANPERAGSPRETRPFPVPATATADRLQGERSSFATRLAPFFTGYTGQVHHIDGKPLAETTRTYLKRQSQDVRVAILTDDQHREELYETAKLAGQFSPEVLVFITPDALFEGKDITDIDQVYGRYADFERFRTQLDRIENVTAFEVAPGDKLQTVLTHHNGAKQ